MTSTASAQTASSTASTRDTGIAISEGPAFTPALRGKAFGVDFNPVVDKIRVVSDDRQNLRLNVDEGTVLSTDKDLNPGLPMVVAAGYENSSFSFTQPAATTLHVVDAASDMLFTQAPPNDGTLTNGRRLGIDVGLNAGFDIAGSDNLGFLDERHVASWHEPLHGRSPDRQDEVARHDRRRQAPRRHRLGGLAGLTALRGRVADPAARPLRSFLHGAQRVASHRRSRRGRRRR